MIPDIFTPRFLAFGGHVASVVGALSLAKGIYLESLIPFSCASVMYLLAWLRRRYNS